MKIFPKKIFWGKSSLKITFFVARFREEPISRYMVAENRELSTGSLTQRFFGIQKKEGR